MTGIRDWFQPVPETAEGRFFAREASGYGLLVDEPRRFETELRQRLTPEDRAEQE